MPAEIEEIVAYADAIDFQYRGEDRGELLLERRARRNGCRIGAQPIGRRKRFPVELAVRRQRHLVERHKRGRHHVIGKQVLEEASELLGARGRARVVGNEIGRQAFLTRMVFPREDRCFTQLRMLTQARFDLTQFDPEAS